MKKIKTQVNPKDRIICVTFAGSHKFYFQSYKSKEQLCLFDKRRSPSIYSFFKDYGVCLNGLGYSITLKQFYEHRNMYRNHKLKELFDRLPGMIDYVLRENTEQNEQGKGNNRVKNARKINFEDHEFAA